MTLACPCLTRNLSRQDPLSASSSPTYPSKLNHITNATYKSFQQPPPHWSYPTSSQYLESTQSTASALFDSGLAAAQYMQNDPAHYPEVRVQQSTPNHALHGLPSSTPPPLLSDEGDFSSVPWNYQDASYLVPNSQQQYTPTSYRSHKRLSSGSSVGSTGPDSPYTQSFTYPRIVDPDTQSVHSAHLDPFDGSSVGQYPKGSYALSAQNNDQSFYPQFESFSLTGNNAASMMAVQAGSRNNRGQTGTSVTNGGKNALIGSFAGDGDSTTAEMRTSTPQLDRTMSDIYQDELFNPAMSAPSSRPRPSVNTQGNLLSPQMSAFNDILQAANNGHLTARSASPAVGAASRRSPFRDTSQYAQTGFQSNPNSPAARLISASQMREQQKMEEAYAQSHQASRHDFMSAPKTISPKEALLDYNETEEDSKMPLFPSPKREPGVQQPTSLYDRPLARLNTENSTDQNYASMATSRCQSSKRSTSPAPPSSGSNIHFLPPSVPHQLQQYPFISQSRRQSSSMRSGSDQVPDFPASLVSMESTKSESGQAESVRLIPEHSPPSSQEAPIRRPLDTSANSGTYTCTGMDCHARFDNAGKLQKHRREAHRSSPNASSTPTTPLSATNPHNQQAAANNVSRNNQPGPHKCERVNPSTGKPCNTIFSRSYDLTRHEDTIHSNRKQKVRCHLCTEEKTFSRNDALTRHMRVVHPDVDFPGKTRRGRNSEGVDVVRQRIEGGRGGR